MEEEHCTARKERKINQWNEERMKKALEQYQNQVENGQNPTLRHLARAWNIPKLTLQRHVRGLVRGFHHASGKNPILYSEAEKELADLIRVLVVRGFPISHTDVQNIAFQYAKANSVKGFLEKKQKVGYYWFEGFLRRNQHLRICTPEPVVTEFGICPTPGSEGLSNYEQLLRELKIINVPSNIWTCREFKLKDIFTPFIGALDTEEGETTTVLSGFNTTGRYTPLMVIFKEQCTFPDWICWNPDQAVIRVSENGWISSELLVEWGEMFTAQLPEDDSGPHVLLLDGHYSQIFNQPDLQPVS